jgi:hypothetical protein
MEHTTPNPAGTGGLEMQEGDRFSCPNCGCRIVLEHHGDPEKMQPMQAFICCCGKTMRQEQQ